MAVATIGAASLAPVFESLYGQVTKATPKNTNLKTLLGFLQSTLDSFRDRIIHPVQQGHQILYDQDNKLESAVVELQKGAKLVAKVSELRSWSCFWLDGYMEKLIDLDRYLRFLVEAAWVAEFVVVMQQNREVNRIMDVMARRVCDAYNKREEAGTVAPVREPVREPTVAEVERGSDEEEEAVLAVFRRLFEAVREREGKSKGPWLNRCLVSVIELTMYSLQPFMELVATHNRAVSRPREEVRSLRVEMEKGVEMVRRSRKKKHICGLLELNQCLQREVCIMRRQMAKNAKEALDWVRKMERAVDGIVSNVGGHEQAGASGTT